MKTVILGRSGLAATRPALGCLPLQRCTVEEAVKILRRACEGGVRFFDTAHDYTDSELKIGQALGDVREEILLASKSHALTYEGILTDIRESLERLRTDHIDLFQLHQLKALPDFDDPHSIYGAMLEAKRRGWVLHLGFSCHKLDVARAGVLSGRFETCQFPFSYLATDEEKELVALCRRENVGFIAMKGLSGGLLTDARACHAFMEQFDNVVPIWGVQRPEEMEQWLALAEEDPALDDELRAVIEKDRSELTGGFCRGCGYCLPCPEGIEINNAARMNMLLRRSPWKKLVSDKEYEKMQRIENCRECYQCASRCPYGLDTPQLLKYMLKDYNRFYEEHVGPRP